MAEITEVSDPKYAKDGEFEPYSYDKKYLLIEIEVSDTPGVGETTARLETNGLFGTEYEELLNEVLYRVLGV